MLSLRRFAIVLAALAVAAAIALVLGAGGLWSHRSSRDAVNRYIKSVDDVQQQMRLPLTRLLTVYRSFSTHGATRQEQRQLAEAERTLRTLELRLSALDPPPEAATLHRLLVRLVEQERAVAYEVDQLARFLPRFDAAVAESKKANARLALALAAVRPPKAHSVRGTPKQIAQARAAYAAAATRAALAEADAIDAFDRTLARSCVGFARSAPPPVMAPAYRAQLVRARGDGDRGRGAGAASFARRIGPVFALLRQRLSEAARMAGSVASQQVGDRRDQGIQPPRAVRREPCSGRSRPRCRASDGRSDRRELLESAPTATSFASALDPRAETCFYRPDVRGVADGSLGSELKKGERRREVTPQSPRINRSG